MCAHHHILAHTYKHLCKHSFYVHGTYTAIRHTVLNGPAVIVAYINITGPFSVEAMKWLLNRISTPVPAVVVWNACSLARSWGGRWRNLGRWQDLDTTHRSDGPSVSDSGWENILITKDFLLCLNRIEWLCFYTIIFDFPHSSSTAHTKIRRLGRYCPMT